jgi:outer membrane protein assembly factor BamB
MRRTNVRNGVPGLALLGAVSVGLLVVVACSSSHGPSAPSSPAFPFESGSPWPKFRGNASQTALGDVHPSQAGSGAQWKFATGRGIFSSPVVSADGTVYFGSADQTFYALNADGTVRWKVPTGEIIDSAGLLDDRGRVYFGSGDGILRAVDAKSGAVVWSMQADDPSKVGSLINWFEGNVAMGPKGTLYVPNDNFLVYALDRDTGAVTWSYKMPDQTWSLPGIDAKTGMLFIGNNNLLPLLGKNTFALDPDKTTEWTKATLGTIAASPLVTADGKVVVGGFDGYTRAYNSVDGTFLWELATRDHIYASPAQLPDGTIVQPSADGTVYALSPADGTVRWTFDAGTPMRSSPAVDADGNVYVGGGDGNLYVLRADGSLRFAVRLIDDVRNDLNSSPALGRDAVYIGGESGEMFSVPYDWCLRAQNASDARCTTTRAPAPDGASLAWVNAFGDMLAAPPATLDGNDRVTLLLAVRVQGTQQIAVLDSKSIQVTLDPPADVTTDVSGDGKFVSITPKKALPAGPLSIAVHAGYLVGLDRNGLRLSGGHSGGTVDATFTTHIRASTAGALDATSTYEVTRLSVPLPTVMPSYNQIGFDQMRYLLGTVEATGATGLAWMVGAKLSPGPAAGGASVVDPATQAVFPMAVDLGGDLATMTAASGLEVHVMNFTLPFQSFRLATAFAPGGESAGTAEISGSAVCGQIAIYGPFLQQLGLCNPQTDVIRVLGAANVARRTDLKAPPAAGTVTFAKTSNAVVATVSGSAVRPEEHLAGILVVDPATGLPVTLPYGTGTTRKAAPDGTLATVSVPVQGMAIPAMARVYLMIDTTVGAKGTLP